MRVIWVVGWTALAIALQSTAARFLPGSVGVVDLVLVVVIYSALASGSVTGLLAGAFAGLVQDSLSSGSGVVGIGALAKTVVGFITGIAGVQFIVAEPPSRFVAFFSATIVHTALFLGISVLLGLRSFDRPYAATLQQGLGNAIVGVLAFEVAEYLPLAAERRRLSGRRLRR